MNDIIVRIAAAAFAIALLPGAPALAQERTTILSNAVTEPPSVQLSINGGKSEPVGLIGYGDVTVRPGRNTLTVRWETPIKRLDFRITSSTSPSNVKDVLIVRADAAHDARLRRAGSRTYTFTIPR